MNRRDFLALAGITAGTTFQAPPLFAANSLKECYSMAKPFQIAVPEAALDDLNRRLAATRWPEALPNRDWKYGTDPTYLRELCAYWRGGFDWRAREAQLNAFPQFRANVEGCVLGRGVGDGGGVARSEAVGRAQRNAA